MTIEQQQSRDRIASERWQRIATDDHESGALIDYLERVAADPFVQQIARDAGAARSGSG